jgi:hypothetical protein
MTALEVLGELDDSAAASDRPTIPMPAPRESGVRLNVERIATFAATVDVVMCDLTRDPRSESYIARRDKRSGLWAKQAPGISEPAASTVRALGGRLRKR